MNNSMITCCDCDGNDIKATLFVTEFAYISFSLTLGRGERERGREERKRGDV